MTTSYTTSNTETFTRAHARQLASKVAADLLQMKQFYGQPADAVREAYIAELIEVLAGDYLSRMDYGFKRDGKWVAVLRYTVQNGVLQSDDRSGRVPAGMDISNSSWASFRVMNSRWDNLTDADRGRVDTFHPVKRSSGNEAGFVAGMWMQDKSYSAGGTTMQRNIFKPI